MLTQIIDWAHEIADRQDSPPGLTNARYNGEDIREGDIDKRCNNQQTSIKTLMI